MLHLAFISRIRRLNLLRAALLIAVLVTGGLLTSWASAGSLPSLLFQSSPEPEPESAPKTDRVSAAVGGERKCGPSVRVLLPVGFTKQSDAAVYCDMVNPPQEIDKGRLVGSAMFALGIWPPNDQVVFERPLELRITLNGADIKKNPAGFDLLMYDQKTRKWVVVPSTLNKSKSELSAKVQTFKPVASNYPNWGGRTLFAVAKKAGKPAAGAAGAGAAVGGQAKTKTPAPTPKATPKK